MKASPHTVPLPLHPFGPATCFGTLRLAGSLPAHVRRELQEHQHACQQILAGLSEVSKKDAVSAEQQLSCMEEFDRHLVKHHGSPSWLGETAVATMVSEALRHGDGTDYDLLLYCIMPNHVHCVIDTGRFHGQERHARKVLSALKRQTAHEANTLLRRSGTFWEHDHLEFPVENSETFTRILWDVLADPVRSDLCPVWHEWPWSYCRPGLGISGTL